MKTTPPKRRAFIAVAAVEIPTHHRCVVFMRMDRTYGTTRSNFHARTPPHSVDSRSVMMLVVMVVVWRMVRFLSVRFWAMHAIVASPNSSLTHQHGVRRICSVGLHAGIWFDSGIVSTAETVIPLGSFWRSTSCALRAQLHSFGTIRVALWWTAGG